MAESLGEYLTRKQLEQEVNIGTDDSLELVEALDFLSSSYDIAEKRTSIIFIPFILFWNLLKGAVMGIVTLLSGGMVLYGSTLKTPAGRQLDDLSMLDAVTPKGTKSFFEKIYKEDK